MAPLPQNNVQLENILQGDLSLVLNISLQSQITPQHTYYRSHFLSKFCNSFLQK